MSKINRFQVRYGIISLDYQPIFTADTTKDIYELFLLGKTDCGGLIVKDIVDDIFVDADDFKEVFESGECPGDLQFF